MDGKGQVTANLDYTNLIQINLMNFRLPQQNEVALTDSASLLSYYWFFCKLTLICTGTVITPYAIL